MRLKGKVAIITGAARGIGKTAAWIYAQEGASVAAFDISADELRLLEEEARKAGLLISGYVVDISNLDQVVQAVDAVFQKQGKIDILINNAGITRDALLMKMSPEQWDQVISVNLTGAFYMTQTVALKMRDTGGSIISTSSVVGVYGNIGQTNYAAAKAGIIGMTRSWAKELARYKIRANAVAPGFIKTPMTEPLPEKVIQYVVDKTPLKVMGDPEDVAWAFVFFGSDESKYVTGQVLGVDGGLVL